MSLRLLVLFGHAVRRAQVSLSPVENVIAEIKSMKTRVVFFLDDNIFSSESYCRELFSELKS